MNPRTQTALKMLVLLFAVLGVLAAIAVGMAWYDHRQRHQEAPQTEEGTAMLQAIYGGIPTRLGVVTRQAEKDMGKVVVKHYLIQSLGQQASSDGQHSLLVYGIREIKLELAAKIETGEIDIAKLADSSTADLLVDLERGRWIGSAAWMVKKDGQWHDEVCCKELFWRGEAATAPQVEWLALAPKTPSFKVGENYFALVDGAFESVLALQTEVDDLEECLSYRAQASEREQARQAAAAARQAAATARAQAASQATSQPAAAAASGAASTPAAREEPVDDEEEMADTEPDFLCAKARTTVQIKPQTSAGFYLLQVQIEGEGPSRETQTASYELSFEPKEKKYGFQRVNGHLMTDPLLEDFINKLNPSP